MNHSALRAAGASVLALALAACSGDQPTDATSTGARLDVLAAAGPALVINEVMPNPAGVADELGEWFEIYNGGSTPVDLQNYRIGSNNDAVHVINQSLVVPAGGYVVLARNGDASVNGGVTANYSYAHQTFNLNNSATDWLALRSPDGATLDSVSWGTASPPNGAARGVIDPAADNTVMSGGNWSTQTSVYGLGDKGTPGAANDGGTVTPPPPPPANGAVVINEILQDPRAVLDANGEWFEVHNRGTTPVSLQGWTIASGGDASHVIASAVSIPAGGYAVLGRDGNTATNGGVTLAYVYAGTTTLNLGNGTDWLALRDASGATLDSVAWTSTTSGAARALTDPATDNTNVNGAAWTNATATFGAGDRGTPGLSNGTVVDPGPGGNVASISLSINAPRQIPVGYTKPAFPTARDAAGATVTGVTYTWTSSNPSVAAVDSLGYIRGLAEGTATISAAAPNGVAGTASITILPADVPTTAVYRNHVEFGTPEAQGVLVRRDEYVSSYSAVRGGPNWVSWNLNATQFGTAARCDCFTADETLPAGTYRVVDFDYRNGGYDRGHMVQSESRTATFQENASTFLMTNILPQAGENNQGPWVQFENYLNDLARQDGKEIYVVAGGEYTSSPATLKNEGKVQVPAFTWKVAVILDGGEGLDDVRGYGDLQVLAIRMPNDTATARGIRNNPWQMYTTTVDDIEARTGYDLLDALPNTLERVVEANDRAPVAATDGPYVGIEGASVTLSAAASSDPDGDALTYAWSFGDGQTGTGVSPSHTYADNGTFQVQVVVTDAYGAADTATTTVTVMNAAPVVAAFAGGALLRGETYTAAGTFGDAGADSWTATVDYGDGSGALPLALSGESFALSHRYTAAGTFTVTVRVTDDDGDTGTRTATVTVQSAGQAVGGLEARVDALVAAGTLARGNGTALVAKLNAAAAALERGQGATAVNQLGAFVNQVEALVQAGRLPAAQGAALTAAAQRIVESIQGA